MPLQDSPVDLYEALARQLRVDSIRCSTAAGSGTSSPGPTHPRPNGKVERFIRTSIEEWAYARPYRRSKYRTAALEVWLRYDNCARRHSGIGRLTPFQRLVELRLTNVLVTHT